MGEPYGDGPRTHEKPAPGDGKAEDGISEPQVLIKQARLAAADTELASHQAAAMISRLADALELTLPVVEASVAWVGEIRTWAEDVSETDEALMDAVDVYRVALSSPAASDWPAQQRRIAAKIAERYEQEAP